MPLFRKRKGIKLTPYLTDEKEKREQIPEDLLDRCPKCRQILVQNQVSEVHCCPSCHYHMYFPANARIQWLLDEDTFEEWNKDLATENPIDFPDYEKKIEKAQENSKLKEAIITGRGTIQGSKVAIGVMDSRFIMASMGTIVGEKIVRLFEHAIEEELPVVIFIASGGARMQEGILSLMQMAKISQAVSNHSQRGLFYLPVLTHPTTGGVTASFAMQGDIILAEPEATIGFAGKRVIEQTIKSKLPKDFQQAETVLKNGFIDNIIPREEQKETISQLLVIHSK